ncbi:MAG: NUDIX domain-containing protein [Acidimicrobiales bacterium]
MGSELLVLPSAAVLPRHDDGRLLLLQIVGTGRWAAIGGAIEPDESPAEAAVRGAEEDAGVTLRLGPILGVSGGPEHSMAYPKEIRPPTSPPRSMPPWCPAPLGPTATRARPSSGRTPGTFPMTRRAG